MLICNEGDSISGLLHQDSIFWKSGRLETFKNWPFNSLDCECTAERMAAAGFFLVGGSEEPDLVECFICAKQLDGWEPTDEPWSEHKKHQANCFFIKFNKQDELTWTVQELLTLLNHFVDNRLVRLHEKQVSSFKSQIAALKKSIPQAIKDAQEK